MLEPADQWRYAILQPGVKSFGIGSSEKIETQMSSELGLEKSRTRKPYKRSAAWRHKFCIK
jgi:hypothetical protein